MVRPRLTTKKATHLSNNAFQFRADLSQKQTNIARGLIQDAHRENITLVLGAGVSASAGIPTWGSLVRELAFSFGKKATRSSAALGIPPHLEKIYRKLQQTDQFKSLNKQGFDLSPSPSHPFAYQMLLEEIEEDLKSRSTKSEPAPSGKQNPFANVLREALYSKVEIRPHSTLTALVEAIRVDQRRGVRRISRVISFNADDLVEECANHGHDPNRDPVVWPISRASFHPRRGMCANGLPPIPVYHIHGYLPQAAESSRDAPDTLVFTDTQYWDSLASPTSFANRVMSNALHDSHCVFLGLSMTDVNLMRWLGVHAAEVKADKLSEFEAKGKSAQSAAKATGAALRRHYWLRSDSADPDEMISRHLYRRGVHSVSLVDRDADIEALLAGCFSDTRDSQQ